MTSVKSAFNISCNNCGLQKICFPTGLGKADIDRLDDIVERKPSLRKNQHLFEPGDSFKALYAVRAGVIKLYSFSDAGEEMIHGFYLPGDVLGLEALASKIHQLHAVALDTTSVCQIPYDDLQQLSATMPELAGQIMTVMSKEVSEGRLHSELLTKRNADQRIAHFILNLAERYRSRGFADYEFRLSILHRDVALYLGLTPETVSRILAKLHNEDIVTWKKKDVKIHNMEKLLGIAGVAKVVEFCKNTA